MTSNIRWIVEIKNRAFPYVLISYSDLGVVQRLSPREIGLTKDIHNATFFNKKDVATGYLWEIIRNNPDIPKKDLRVRSVKVIVEYTDEK